MYRIPECVRSTYGPDGAVVLDIRQGQMFNLNLVGSRILELLEHGSTEAAIVDQIVRDFQMDKEVVANDVREFTATLRQRQLLENSES